MCARDRCQYLSLFQASTRTSTSLPFSASLVFDAKYLSFSNLPASTVLKSLTVVPETPLHFCTRESGSTAVPVKRDVLADQLNKVLEKQRCEASRHTNNSKSSAVRPPGILLTP